MEGSSDSVRASLPRLVQAKSFNPVLGAPGISLSEKVEAKYGDVALLLYAAPFILNFVYALYVWFGVGFSAVMPQIVYLEVTQSPYVFMAGFAAVALAVVLDFDAEPSNA